MDSSLFKILKNIPALSEIDEDDLKDASKKAVLMGYPKNWKIYDIGDDQSYFYIIKSGMVEILDNKQLQVAKFYPDNFFGEMALVNEVPRNYIARTLENSEIYTLDISDYKDFLYL